MNLITVDGDHANIDYDEEMNQFRGEILVLSGGADIYGSSAEELRREFKKSLNVFLEVCKEQEIEPRRHYSEKFNLRIASVLHEKLAMTAEVQGKSLNTLAQEALQKVLRHRGTDNKPLEWTGHSATRYASATAIKTRIGWRDCKPS